MAFLKNLFCNGMVVHAIAGNARLCHKSDEKREWRKTPAPGGQYVFGEKDGDSPQDGTASTDGAPKGAGNGT